MHVITARNVCSAYHQGILLLAEHGLPENSRNGTVRVVPSPVTTVYERPTERVLFDQQRDANPFFHLFESLWMLSGSDDPLYLDKFVKNFSERYAEREGKSGVPVGSRMYLHGAYGLRWRGHFGLDQLEAVVQRLHRDSRDRRVVISMWDPPYDLIVPEDADPETGWGTEWDTEPRDLPCNTHIYLRVRDVTYRDPPVTDQNSAEWESRIERGDTSLLDLTVCCRSNDIVWGAYGANAVHFSVLQEYLAARLGCGVGRMYQVSNNWHGYDDVLSRVTPLGPDHLRLDDRYTCDPPLVRVAPLPMVTQPRQFLRDVGKFMEAPHDSIYANPWFHTVAVPLLKAHEAFKMGAPSEAMRYTDQVAASDWRMAASAWISRRVK